MARSKVAQPWAKALLDISVDANAVSAHRADLGRVTSLLSASADLQNVFANPTIKVDERKAIVAALVTRLSLGRTVGNFLLLLAEKRRLAYLADIGAVFGEMADAHEGVVRAEVRTPVALTAPQAAKLRETLSGLTGRRVEIEVVLDSTLIGGLQVRVAGRVYDASVSSRLDALRDQILQSM